MNPCLSRYMTAFASSGILSSCALYVSCEPPTSREHMRVSLFRHSNLFVHLGSIFRPEVPCVHSICRTSKPAYPSLLAFLVMVYHPLSPFTSHDPCNGSHYISLVHLSLAVRRLWIPLTLVVPPLHTVHHLLGTGGRDIVNGYDSVQ